MVFTDTLAQYRHDVRALRERVREVDLDQQQGLVEMNLPLVMTLARRYEGRGVDLMDLIQEGNLGLLRAAQKFDPSLGVQFSTYAWLLVKQGILSALPQRIASVSTSTYTFERVQRLLHLQREMRAETGQEPTLAQLAERMGISVASALALLDMQQGLYAVSLDARIGEHEEDTLANLLEAGPYQDPEHVALLQIRNEHMQRLLKLLTKAERKVILLRYGILDGEAHTYEEIKRRTHLGIEKVHSLEQRALLKMRHVATRKQLRDFIG